MRYLLIIILLTGIEAKSQLPRNSSGQFEYSQKITTDLPTVQVLKQKARRFFNQPFLIHWDSVAVSDEGDIVTGQGYINVRAKHHGLSVGRQIPISLQLTIEINDSCYSYTFNHFSVNKPQQQWHFPLEEKPDEVKSMTYDQMLRNTHDRVSFVIGWLKGYMDE